ncbi:MAG: FGGY-family carbohydrate kinase [Acidimicrobiales bacterium]
MSYLGLDLGGSSAKAAAFGVDGSLLATAKVPYLLESPREGWREFNPETQWQALLAAIRAVTSTTDVRHDPIRAIGISVAGEAVVPVAVDKSPLYNAFASFDSRGSEYVPLLRETIGEATLFEITGQPLDGMYTLMRVLWFREHMPSLFRQTWKFCLWQELILLRLGLEPVVDYSNAARTMAFDIHAREWCTDILAPLQLSSELFAAPVPQGAVIGSLGKQVADELGIPAGCTVVAGGLDQSCACLGLGVVDDTAAAIGTGSVEAVDVPIPETSAVPYRPDQFLFVTPYAPGGYLATGMNFTAGSAIEWYRSLTGISSVDDLSLYRSATLADLSPSSLLVLPQFAGSFSPRRNADARAAIFGLSLSTTRAEIARALVEALVFELRFTIESMEEAGLRLGAARNGGGGSRSARWMRLKASILERPIAVPEIVDSSCLGAALLAAVADRAFPDCSSAAAEMVLISRWYQPEASVTDAYHDRYQEYCAVRELLCDQQSAFAPATVRQE